MNTRKIKVIIKNPEETYGHTCWVSDELETYQAIVGGYIEVVPASSKDNVLIICNEEGKLKGLKSNFALGPDVVVGTVIVVGQNGEDFADCPWIWSAGRDS